MGVFLMIHLVPGDPVLVMLSEFASPADVALLRHELGFDQPLYIQYGRFIAHVLHGDFGRSIRTQRTVLAEIASRYPSTAELAIAAMVLAIAIGTLAGIWSAIARNSLADHLVRVGVLLGISMPAFWMGLLLIIVFSLRLGWLPVAGYEGWRYLILPAATLAAAPAATIARLVRSSLLETLLQDYIRTARAKGVREAVVVLRHALKNGLVPVITVMGLQFGYLLGGAVIIESVFAWPGLGRLAVDAILTRDFPVVQGTVLLIGASFVLLNLLVDLLYASLDPRIRYR